MSLETRHRAVRVAPAVLSVVGAVYIVLVAVYSRPIADDWRFIVDAQRWGFGRYMSFNLRSSGRFSQFALAWLSSRLFGSDADEVVPMVLLVLALGLGTWTVRGIGRLVTARMTWAEASCLALLALVSAIATAPSAYDTIAWFAAVAAYLAGVVTALGVSACFVDHVSRGGRHVFFAAASLGVIAAIAGGFDELLGASMTLAGILAILTARDLHRGVKARRQSVTLGGITLGAAVGTAANVFAPGARSRALAQGAHVSLSAAARTAVHNLSFVTADVHDGVLLLAVATGIVAWQLLGPIEDIRVRRWTAVWAVFLLIVPWLVTSALTAWARSTESGDRSPFRAAFIGTGSVSLGVVLVVLLTLSLWPTVLNRVRATLLALLLVAIGTVGVAHTTAPMIRAERMRAQALTARGAAVKRQLAAGQRTIELNPAPLLTVFTQALDLSFGPVDQQPSGWVSALRQYYGIPAGDAIRITQQQPRDYCLPNVVAPWVGVKSCQELNSSN